MTQRTLTCIGCPMGCSLTVELSEGAVVSVTGNTCAIGDRYARKECTAPERTVTGTVAVRGGTAPVVSVRTAAPVPKDRVLEVATALSAAAAQAPVAAGSVVLPDVAGTGVAVIATRSVCARN